MSTIPQPSGPDEVLAASPLAGAPGLRWRVGVPTVASPMRQATDAVNSVVEADGTAPVFLKVYGADALGFVDEAAAWAGTVAAAEAGVGPAAIFCLPDHHAIATAYLAAPWRAAFLGDLADPGVQTAVIAAKRRLHEGHALARRWDVFAESEQLFVRLKGTNVPVPGDLDALMGRSRAVAAAVAAAGFDLRPCHNDGSASSVMLGPDGAVMLVDFDCAGQADPIYDLALVLNEMSAFTPDWSAGLERYAGSTDPRLLARCRAYAVADDILWGLWGHLQSATSPRRTVEFLKYGEWRLLRARMASDAAGFAGSLHGL